MSSLRRTHLHTDTHIHAHTAAQQNQHMYKYKRTSAKNTVIYTKSLIGRARKKQRNCIWENVQLTGDLSLSMYKQINNWKMENRLRPYRTKAAKWKSSGARKVMSFSVLNRHTRTHTICIPSNKSPNTQQMLMLPFSRDSLDNIIASMMFQIPFICFSFKKTSKTAMLFFYSLSLYRCWHCTHRVESIGIVFLFEMHTNSYTRRSELSSS